MNEKNNKIFNKFYMIIPVLLFVVLLFTMTTGSFAATKDIIVTDRDNNSYTFTLSDELMTPKYFYVYYYKSTKDYRMDVLGYYCSDYELRVSYFSSNGSIHKTFVFADGLKHELKYYETKGMSYASPFQTEIDKFNKLTLNDLTIRQTSSSGSTYFDLGSFMYSNTDVKDVDGSLVFQGAPQVPEITKALVEQTKQVGMSPMEQIKTILPVVLITIVSLIAFWKGLCLVRRILSQA